jgi:hypothetical protein
MWSRLSHPSATARSSTDSGIPASRTADSSFARNTSPKQNTSGAWGRTMPTETSQASRSCPIPASAAISFPEKVLVTITS